MARRRRKRKEGEGFNVWRSYSDMMAGVLLLFVLIMCVTLFQAQKNYVEKLAEQEQRIRIQDEYAAEMKEKEEELAEQDALLAEQRDKLKEQNLTLDEMQSALEEQARILAEKEATLEEQQTALTQQKATMEEQQATLEKQQTTLEEQQATMEAQRTALDSQQATLDSQKATLDEQKTMLESQAAEIESKTQLLQEKQAQIDRIVGVKAEVIEALRQEFISNNVNVKIDPQTGALVLDSNVMFDYDDTTLSEEGQAVLLQVLPIYCHVLLSDKYVDNVAEIIIDGYTDTDGSYEYNLDLSQRRSLAVAQFLLENEGTFLNGDESATLREILTVNGHSMSHPVLDAQGEIDMDASRRVEVKFRLKDEEMIEELRALME